MNDPLYSLRQLADSPARGVRLACLLEATAPKAGNVYPGRSFDQLSYVHFVAAAEIASNWFARSKRPISERMLGCVCETTSLTRTNVNLGIVLLLGPLVAADEALTRQGTFTRTRQDWVTAVSEVLGSMNGVDGQNIFRAIGSASAGGLGKVEAMDVSQTCGPVDIVQAMRLAADRDRVARQYASGFLDLMDGVVPVLWESICQCTDLLQGISRAHLRLLMLEPDSLIARKNSMAVAITVQSRAQGVVFEDPTSMSEFDDSLRSEGHQLNPGTTADLIAAALYVLLRTPLSRETR